MSDEQMFKAVKQYEQYGEIIPCCECKYYRIIPDTLYGTCTKTRHNSVKQALDYCSLAERKTDE